MKVRMMVNVLIGAQNFSKGSVVEMPENADWLDRGICERIAESSDRVMTVAELTEFLSDCEDMDALASLLDHELKGKNRSTAIEAIEARMSALQG